MSLVCLYSHDGEGLGHLRRNTNIVEHAARQFPELSAVLLTGCQAPHAFGVGECYDTVKVPTLLKDERGAYQSTVPGLSAEQIRQMRSQLMLEVVSSSRPSLMIVDKYPAGLNNELEPTLKWLRRESPRTPIVLGMRDVLDSREATNREWLTSDSFSLIDRYYDLVWIYSDPSIFPTADYYDFPDSVKAKCHYTGYLVGRMPDQPAGDPNVPYLVATVGGGRDGRPMLEATLQAVETIRTRHPELRLHLFAGALMAQTDFAELRRMVSPHRQWARLDRFSMRLKRYLIGAEAIITMGGYNTTFESICAGRPSVIVPRSSPRSEQLIRARILQEKGYIRMLEDDRLDPDRLADELRAILDEGWRPRDSEELDMNGYQTVLRDMVPLLDHDNMAGSDIA